MIKMTCKCGTVYEAREADVKRGWGKSCSKSCAAKKRTAKERSGANIRLAPASLKYQKPPRHEADDHEDDPSWGAHESYSFK
jgi:hypothetical protein